MDIESRAPRHDPSIAIVAVTRNGVGLAMELQAKLPGSVCYVPHRHSFALAMGAVGFERIGTVIPEIWGSCDALVCIMATGIVVRGIAPLLHHKATDPAVVVLDERAHHVISLVSGHLGGANALARRIAALTGGQAVITTASDVERKPSVDLIARELGLQIETPEMLSRVARAILEDEPLWVFDPDGRLTKPLEDLEHVVRLAEDDPGLLEMRNAPGIWVSERLVPPRVKCLVLRPRNLVVGIGCNRGTGAEEILEHLQEVFTRIGLSTGSIKNLASVDVKSDECGLLEAAKKLDRPILFYSRSELEKVAVPNPSRVVESHIGVKSVCEATALLSAGSEKLLIPKQKTTSVTLAVARVACRS